MAFRVEPEGMSVSSASLVKISMVIWLCQYTCHHSLTFTWAYFLTPILAESNGRALI